MMTSGVEVTERRGLGRRKIKTRDYCENKCPQLNMKFNRCKMFGVQLRMRGGGFQRCLECQKSPFVRNGEPL